jgi:hypothetical protein
MHTLFAHAKRHEPCDKNPIEDVRQSSKRIKKPTTLAINDVKAIMHQVTSQAIRVAILVAAVTVAVAAKRPIGHPDGPFDFAFVADCRIFLVCLFCAPVFGFSLLSGDCSSLIQQKLFWWT